MRNITLARHVGLYCEFMAQEDWERRLTRSVAAQVRRYRQERKMSAQDLSDRCAELGVRIARPVLSNLENGRRESITLAELLVLAQVLDVPPTLLIAPVETEPIMEILPGREVKTTDVLEWFAGEARFVPEGESGLDTREVFWPSGPGPAGLVHLYRAHNMLVSLLQAEMTLGKYVPGDPELVEGPDAGPGELHLVRRVMREEGLRVPDLPPELAHLDPAEPTLDELGDRIRHAVRRA